MSKKSLSFKDYCLAVENMPYYDLLLPDELSEVEDNYKWYCIENGYKCEFYLDEEYEEAIEIRAKERFYD